MANGISAVLSSVVILLYAFDLIEMHFMNLYSVPLHYNLLPWLLIYLFFRSMYWFAVGFIDKKRRENMPMWLLDEDVFLLGKVRNGKFYPDSDKCGFYSQSIDSTMYGRSLFESLDDAIAVCGELPVIESESYIEE
ncbi:MAG: hypothetical protein IKW68_02640 [Clostridia bacterium]|nr:hypothetical protein [Clostridia bacterium]